MKIILGFSFWLVFKIAPDDHVAKQESFLRSKYLSATGGPGIEDENCFSHSINLFNQASFILCSF